MSDWWQFKPDEETVRGIEVPYFEDARADFAPYYRSRDTEAEARRAVLAELHKLDAFATFHPGMFTVRGEQRYGYEVRFHISGQPGVIRVAGLPFRGKATSQKVAQVRVQALLNVRDWIKTGITSQVFTPGYAVLVPFLLVDGSRTIMDVLVQTGKIPQLNPPPDDPQILIERGE